jgi:hypothetical protein
LDLALLNLQIIGDSKIHALFDGQVLCTVLSVSVILKNKGEKNNPTAVPLHHFNF